MEIELPMNLTVIGISNKSPAPRFTLMPDTEREAEADDPGRRHS